MILVSFDIDGTLETGEPPGPLALDLVRLAKARGHVIGSASDRTVAHQQRMWDDASIAVDFVGHKHHLNKIIGRFTCSRHVHIGDTETDRHYAVLAGLEFVHVDEVPQIGAPGWIL